MPAELYTLSVRVRGYHESKENESLDPLDGMGLLGRIDGDVLDLVLLLEPGARIEPDSSREAGEIYVRLMKSPLRGAPKDKVQPAPERR